MRILAVLLFAAMAIPSLPGQQDQPPDATTENAKQAASKKDKNKKEPMPGAPATPDKSPESRPGELSRDSNEATDKEEHYDVAEVPPVITHHQATLNGKALGYTATAGRLPIKREDGKIEAEMFFVRRRTGQRQAPSDICIQRRTGLGLGVATHGRPRTETRRTATERLHAGSPISSRREP